MAVGTDTQLRRPVRTGWSLAGTTPPAGVEFWAMAVCVCAVGGFFGSLVAVAPGPGRVGAVGAAAAWLGAAVAFRLRARRGLAWWFWITTLLAGVAAEAVVTLLLQDARIPVALVAAPLGGALWCAAAVWWYLERTRGRANLCAPRWQVFFWATLVAAISLGDVLSQELDAAFGLALAAVAVVVVLLLWPRRSAATLAFWTGFVLLQPFGTGLESFLARPRRSGGLGVGSPDTVEFFVLSALSLAAHQACARPHTGDTTAHNG